VTVPGACKRKSTGSEIRKQFTIQECSFGKTARKETIKTLPEASKNQPTGKSHKNQTTASEEKVDEVMQTSDQSRKHMLDHSVYTSSDSASPRLCARSKPTLTVMSNRYFSSE